MGNFPLRRPPWVLTAVGGFGVAVVALTVWFVLPPTRTPGRTPPALTLPPEAAEASAEQVQQLCATCHAYPPPDTFPRSAWRRELKQAYDFFHDSPLRFDYPGL